MTGKQPYHWLSKETSTLSALEKNKLYQSVAASGKAPGDLAGAEISPAIAECIKQSWRLDPEARTSIAGHLPALRSMLVRCVSVRHDALCTDTVDCSLST